MLPTRPEQLRIDLPLEAIARACEKYGVSELAVFGSVLRGDFDPNRSDVDFLVKFLDNDAGPWMSKFADLEEELASLLGRAVELTDWNGVLQSTNPYRRGHILKHARTIYVA
jgi:predicted nucleotidyltransferase